MTAERLHYGQGVSVSAEAARRILLSVIVAGVGLRLLVAATTFGTNDVHYWTEFALGVREFGPIGIYGHLEFSAPYNHPPLVGLFLLLVGTVADAGVSLPLLVRLPACLADGVTCWLVFRWVQERYGMNRALGVAVTLALSPALVIVSGFHGNTDPVFIALLLCSCRAATTGWPAASGVAFGLGVSVKIVPAIALPLLALVIWRSGRVATLRFAASLSATLVVVWGPALLLRPAEVFSQVIAYRGIAFTEWGVPEFVRWAGLNASSELLGHAGGAVALMAAAGGVLTYWRGLLDPEQALALSLVLLLVLAPAFAMQYLIWPLAVAHLLNVRLGMAYNVAVSAFMLLVYSHWSRAWPGDWYEAVATPFVQVELPLMFLSWAVLFGMTIDTFMRLRASRRHAPP